MVNKENEHSKTVEIIKKALENSFHQIKLAKKFLEDTYSNCNLVQWFFFDLSSKEFKLSSPLTSSTSPNKLNWYPHTNDVYLFKIKSDEKMEELYYYLEENDYSGYWDSYLSNWLPEKINNTLDQMLDHLTNEHY